MDTNKFDQLFKDNIEGFELSDAPMDWNSSQAWANFEGQQKKRVLMRRSVMLVAASVAVLIALGIFMFRPAKQEWVQIETGLKQIKEVDLPDGNKVFLNADSKMLYPKSGNNKICEIYIQGEAWFEMMEPSDIEYRIVAGTTLMVCHQSKFNLKAIPASGNIKINVAEGKLNVSESAGTGYVLAIEKGKYCDFNTSNKLILSGEIEDDNFLAWKTKRISFDKTPLISVVSILSDYYQVKIDLKNEKIQSCRISETFENKSLEDVLKEIKQITNTKIKKEKHGYILDGNGC